MAKKQIWTVRVIVPTEHDGHVPDNHLLGVWIEQLQHMGIVKVLKEDHAPVEGTPYAVLEFEYPGRTTGIDTQIWARQEAERMQSFGINAVHAPKWDNRPFGA